MMHGSTDIKYDGSSASCTDMWFACRFPQGYEISEFTDCLHPFAFGAINNANYNRTL